MSIEISEIYPSFVESLQEIFETMVFIPAKAGAPLSAEQEAPRGTIAGSLSITSDDVIINISLIFGTELAYSVFRAMMGMEESDPVEIEEVSDIVGELANMTSGGAKTRMQEEHPHLQLGLPTVVVGKELYIEPAKNAKTIIIPLETEAGTLYLEVTLSD